MSLWLFWRGCSRAVRQDAARLRGGIPAARARATTTAPGRVEQRRFGDALAEDLDYLGVIGDGLAAREREKVERATAFGGGSPASGERSLNEPYRRFAPYLRIEALRSPVKDFQVKRHVRDHSLLL